MYEESSSTLNLVSHTVLWPFLLGFVLLSVVKVVSVRAKTSRHHSIYGMATSAAVLIGFVVAYTLINPTFRFPPRVALDGILVLALLAFGFGAVVTFAVLPSAARMALQLLIIVAGNYLLMAPLFGQWSIFETVTYLGGTTIVWLFLWAYLEKLRELSKPAIFNTVLVALPAGAAPVIAVGGTLLIGQLVGALAAALAACWLLDINGSRRIGSRSLAAVLALPLGGLLVMAYQFAEVDLLALLTVLGLLLIPELYRRVMGNQQFGYWWVSLQVAVLSLIPIGLALWRVWPEQSLY